MGAVRVTLTLDDALLTRARRVGGSNFSRFVGEALESRVEQIQRDRLHEALLAGCREDADLDLEICRDWEPIDCEMGLRVEP